MGGALYVAMSMSTRNSVRAGRSLAVRRPGWIARRRARGSIAHRGDRIGVVGYTAAVRAVHLTLAELAGHGLAAGGPKSGKTTFLQLLVEASADRLPVVLVDPKGSPALADTVRAHGGQVWTLDGKLPADLLDPRPWQVPDMLLEAEDYQSRCSRVPRCGEPARVVGGLRAGIEQPADGPCRAAPAARPRATHPCAGAAPTPGPTYQRLAPPSWQSARWRILPALGFRVRVHGARHNHSVAVMEQVLRTI